MKTVAVITATTGRESLLQTIESVKQQTYPCNHYIFAESAYGLPEGMTTNENIIWLPKPTGVDGMMNGGIVAASAYLVTEDYICWLDDDNWFETNHIETLMQAMGNNLWSYSLRKLMELDGSFWDYDDGESLGVWTGFVDLNCYLMDRVRLATQIAPAWYIKTDQNMYIGDRGAYKAVNSVPGQGTGLYTVNYRLNTKRDLKPFFKAENEAMRKRFNNNLPWRRT